jgi:hypothetical protein
MSNQTILWGMLILPWLTLLFMPKEDIKRWMPAALFVVVSNTLIIEVGIAWQIFETRENVYPLSEMISYVYGALPVGSMWILKYTYGRFWLYAAIQTIGSFVLILLVQPLLHRRGIFVWIDETDLAGIGAFMTTVVHFIAVYLYQMWQEGIFLRSEIPSFSANVHPALAKPLPKERGDKNDNE